MSLEAKVAAILEGGCIAALGLIAVATILRLFGLI